MTAMNLSLSLSFRSPEPSLFHRRYSSPIKYPQKQQVPNLLRPKLYPKIQFPIPKTQFRVTARKWSPMEGLSQEMNTIASQNLDHAPARRRVRSAFIDVHKQLDHCLFKVGLIRSWSCYCYTCMELKFLMSWYFRFR